MRPALLAMRLCSEAWLDAALPVLQAHAADDGDLEAALDALDGRLQGGLLPDEVLPGRGALAAFVVRWLAEARPDGVERIRRLRIALPWAARALGLPPPDGAWAAVGLEALAMGVDLGRVSEAEWFCGVEEALVDAYLATGDPRAQSGKSGDEVDWRWSRELVLDCFDGDASVLDVGCANGYLMASLHRWAAERGRVVEPWGLEISERLARVARRQQPAWADRIFVGNALDWRPERRFDVVHTGLDYVLPRRRRKLVTHLLRRVVAPGGRLVLRAERVIQGVATPAEQLRALGFEVSGTVEAAHPRTGVLRTTSWIVAVEVRRCQGPAELPTVVSAREDHGLTEPPGP